MKITLEWYRWYTRCHWSLYYSVSLYHATTQNTWRSILIIVAKVHAWNRADKKAKKYTHTADSYILKTFVKIALDLFCLATDKDGQRWMRPTKTGCSHSGFRFPKHTEKKRSHQWTPQKLKNIQRVKIGRLFEDWSHICPFEKDACGVGLGPKNAQLVDIVIPVLAARASHPQSAQIFNEDQVVLQLDPVFVADVR